MSIVLNLINFSLNDVDLNGCGTKVYQYAYNLLHSNSKKSQNVHEAASLFFEAFDREY